MLLHASNYSLCLYGQDKQTPPARAYRVDDRRQAASILEKDETE